MWTPSGPRRTRRRRAMRRSDTGRGEEALMLRRWLIRLSIAVLAALALSPLLVNAFLDPPSPKPEDPADLKRGLVGHWPLAGDTRDGSGLGHDAVNRGADLKAPGPEGKPGGAAGFDGRGPGRDGMVDGLGDGHPHRVGQPSPACGRPHARSRLGRGGGVSGRGPPGSPRTLCLGPSAAPRWAGPGTTPNSPPPPCADSPSRPSISATAPPPSGSPKPAWMRPST